ncbi:MAG: cell division protein FtsX [Flavobacteriales bacterium]|nr:cell division protein FtsX [Flavobacteriales bacterium]
MRKKLFKNDSSSGITTIISLSLVLFVVGLLSFILLNTDKVEDKMKESIVFTIMIHNEDGESSEIYQNKKIEFESFLKSSEYFKEVKFIDKETAFKNLQEDLGEDFSEILENNPLLNSYDAYVNAEFVNSKGLREIDDFISSYNGNDMVQNVFYQKDLIENLNENVNKISLFLLGFCLVFFLIAFALINNTIRLSIYSKRLLIRTMRLVGATNMFIQKPYLISGIYQGFISSVLSIFMLIISLEFIDKQLPNLIQTNEIEQLAKIFAIILIFGIIISWVSTYFAVRRYLNMKENELYN